MRKVPQIGVAMLVFAGVLLVAGCSGDSPTVADTSEGLNLSSEFGGYTSDDELPAFGDAEVASLMKEDPAEIDPVFATGELDSLEALDGTEVYTLAVRWGMLEPDSTVTQVTDWSGMMELKYGALHLARPIRFERGQDHIVRPRPNRQMLEWVSLTAPAFDGVIVTLVVPPPPKGEDWSDNELTLRMVPYSRTFTLAELVDLNEVIDIDELGNQVALNSRLLEFEPCGAGHLDGRWMMNPSGENGHFFGRWISDEGDMTGHLRGHVGVRANERDSVFFGKYIDRSGQFRGLLRGVWGTNADDSASGWFSGIWAGRDGRPRGRLHGNWGSTPPPDADSLVAPDRPGRGNAFGRDRDPRRHPDFGGGDWTRGFFGGVWEALCPETPEDGGDV